MSEEETPGGIMMPKPRYTAFMTLSGWSPNTGMPTTGTPWNAACRDSVMVSWQQRSMSTDCVLTCKTHSL